MLPLEGKTSEQKKTVSKGYHWQESLKNEEKIGFH